MIALACSGGFGAVDFKALRNTWPRGPNFVIVGAPKCVTTAMDQYLAAHPSLFVAPQKETHFFAPDLFAPSIERSMAMPERNFAMFADAPPERLLGESSAFYLLSEQAARNFHDYNPSAKIIIHLRNPIDVIASHHSQVVYEGYEPITSLRDSLAAEVDRRAGRRMPPGIPVPKVLLHHDLVRFGEQVSRFMAVFSRDQVQINLFDDLAQDTPGVYRRTLKFLGVDPTFVPAFDVVNANKVARSGALRSLYRDKHPLMTAVVRTLLPKPVRQAARSWLMAFNTRYEKRPDLDPDLRRALCRDLEPDIMRLATLIDRDLSAWIKR